MATQDNKNEGFRDNLRPEGKKYAYRFVRDGKLYTGTIPTASKAEAEAFIQDLRFKQYQQKKLGLLPVPTLKTLGEALVRHLRTLKRSEGHINEVVRIFEFLETWHDDLIDTITGEVLDEMIQSYRETPILKKDGTPKMRKDRITGVVAPALTHGEGSIKKLVAILNSAMRFAVTRKLIQQVPYEPPVIGVDEIDWPTLRCYEVPVFLKLVAEMPYEVEERKQWQVVVASYIELLTGCREGTVHRLFWNHIDFKRRVLKVLKGKNKKFHPILFGDALLCVLYEYWVSEGCPEGGLVFPVEHRKTGKDTQGIKGYDTSFTSYAITRAAEHLGREGITPHRLRNTFATLHLELATDPTIVQRLMTHASFETTQRYMMRVATHFSAAQKSFEQHVLLAPGSSLFARLPQFDIPEEAISEIAPWDEETAARLKGEEFVNYIRDCVRLPKLVNGRKPRRKS